MVNGYVFLDLTKSNVYAEALKVLGTDKPVVIKDGSGAPYFVDSLTLDGTNVVITKGGKTITINDANAVSSEGEITAPTLENIKDLAGHNRFIEGNVDVETVSGITFTYNKWSLSGTHLMIVCTGTIADTTVLANNIDWAICNLPEWILDKIYEVFSTYVEAKTVSLRAVDSSVQNIALALGKQTDGLFIRHLGTVTLTAERNFRVQFDLLIDQE